MDERKNMEAIDIALCFDRNIVEYVAVLMCSIYETNKMNLIKVHIVHDGSLTESDKRLLTKTAKLYTREIYFYQTADQLKKLPITNYSPATFIRMFLPQILPETVSKVLYLDIDMVVLDDLRPLFETDFEGMYFACCIDDEEYSTHNFNRIDLPYIRWKGIPYFNAGMMLMDVQKWRELKISEQVLDFMAVNTKTNYKCADQDVLNYLFHEKVKIVDSRYNVLLNFMTDYQNKEIRKEKWEMIESALKNPCIIHLYGYEHPWYRDATNPYCKIWKYFADKAGIKIECKNYFYGKAKWKRRVRDFLSKYKVCAPAKIWWSDKSIKYANKVFNQMKEMDE